MNPGRNDPCWCGSGIKYKRCHLEVDADGDRRERSPYYADALHEAGHAIIAHALGREVELVRVGAVKLEPGHPENPTNGTMISGGYHRAKPLLAGEVNERHAAGLAFTAEQLDWLLTESVICWGGWIAESSLQGQQAAAAHARADLEDLSRFAGMLGETEEHEGRVIVRPAFQKATEEAARAILVELADNVIQLTDVLAEHAPAEFSEETIQAVLAELGSPRGSHRHVIEDVCPASAPRA